VESIYDCQQLEAGKEARNGMNAEGKLRGISSGIWAGLLLVLMATLAGGAALRESVTIDEVSHIGAGVSYLQKLDLRMNPEHPPLPKVLAALPLVLRGVRADYNHISWTLSEEFFPAFLGQWVFGEWLLERWNEPKTVLVWARLPMLLLMLALGWTLYACARQLGGAWGGLLCLSVYVSMPAFLTFGPLVHTDLAVALFSLLALWTFAEVWREPNRKNVLLFGLSLAGALLSKFTAGVLFFAFPAFALSLRWRAVSGQPGEKPAVRDWRRARWRATLKGVLWAAFAVYAFYFVFSWHQPTSALERIGVGPAALTLRRLLLPPLLYLRGVFWVLITGRRPTFVLGHAYSHGVWFYFPVVFALKSPLGFLGLLILSLAVAIGWKYRGGTRAATIPSQPLPHWRVLWVSLLVFTGACLLSPLDISIRHFSVPLVLLTLLLAPLPRMLGELREWTRSGAALGAGAAVALAASCLFTAVRAYPYYFPYLNALSLGRPAYALVNDSNVDWNQSLPEVRRFAQQRGLQRIGLDAYGFSDATVTVPQAQPWNCQSPAPGDAGQWVVLSSNFILDGHNCAWLLPYPHEDLAGGSMYAVHLPTPIPAAGSPSGPPLASAFREFGGAPFEIRGFFLHLYQHPDDLPRGLRWMQTAFSTWNKSPGPPPKPPWEP
jgi:4-amino-4-deoxy-L-arabinose transferase-like glycosyltransferase